MFEAVFGSEWRYLRHVATNHIHDAYILSITTKRNTEFRSQLCFCNLQNVQHLKNNKFCYVVREKWRFHCGLLLKLLTWVQVFRLRGCWWRYPLQEEDHSGKGPLLVPGWRHQNSRMFQERLQIAPGLMCWDGNLRSYTKRQGFDFSFY